MNDDHADADPALRQPLLSRAGDDWRMTGLDPDGCDLRQGAETARLASISGSRCGSCRVELVRLVKRARSQAAAA